MSSEIEQATMEKLEELLTEGQKKLDQNDYDLAIEILSEAASLADGFYDSFAPEIYEPYMKYGRALFKLASDRFKGFDSEMQFGHALSSLVPLKSDVVEAAGDNLIAPKDRTFDKENMEALEELEDLLSDAWSVLEVAKLICQKHLKKVTEDVDIRKWKLNLIDPHYFLGRILVFNSNPDDANVEFSKLIEIKQQYSNDEIELANILHEIGDVFDEVLNSDNAKIYYMKSLELFKKLSAGGDNSDIGALSAICKEIQEKIDSTEKYEKLTLQSKGQAVNMNEKAKPIDSAPVNDASHLIKRRVME